MSNLRFQFSVTVRDRRVGYVAHNPNATSIGSAVFAQLSAECPYTLQWAAPSPLKIVFSHGDLDPI